MKVMINQRALRATGVKEHERTSINDMKLFYLAIVLLALSALLTLLPETTFSSSLWFYATNYGNFLLLIIGLAIMQKARRRN